MLDRSYAAIIAKTLKPKDETLQFFTQSVGSIYTKKLTVIWPAARQSQSELRPETDCKKEEIRD
jgi:hypothetical protein